MAPTPQKTWPDRQAMHELACKRAPAGPQWVVLLRQKPWSGLPWLHPRGTRFVTSNVTGTLTHPWARRAVVCKGKGTPRLLATSLAHCQRARHATMWLLRSWSAGSDPTSSLPPGKPPMDGLGTASSSERHGRNTKSQSRRANVLCRPAWTSQSVQRRSRPAPPRGCISCDRRHASSGMHSQWSG